MVVVLLVTYIVDSNRSCPFFLFCVCLQECRNTDVKAELPGTLQRAVTTSHRLCRKQFVAGFMESLLPFDFDGCGLSVSFMMQLETK